MDSLRASITLARIGLERLTNLSRASTFPADPVAVIQIEGNCQKQVFTESSLLKNKVKNCTMDRPIDPVVP